MKFNIELSNTQVLKPYITISLQVRSTKTQLPTKTLTQDNIKEANIIEGQQKTDIIKNRKSTWYTTEQKKNYSQKITAQTQFLKNENQNWKEIITECNIAPAQVRHIEEKY